MGNFNESVDNAKKMARSLIPYTHPRVHYLEEQEVLLLKQRNLTVDGYEALILYSEADYGKYFLKSLQVQCANGPFLPFTVVCKLGRIFLGSDNLSYVEFYKNNRKVYCWTAKYRGENVLPPESQTTHGSYEGFQFRILHPSSVELF